ncbi:MAG: ribosome maturation factor RimP [Gammaproteobacteria bacterium]
MPDTSQSLGRLIETVVTRMGYELWGHEYPAAGGAALLRVYIDHPEGIDLDDCSAVSDQLSGVLDVEDPIKTAYTLEVSSPGLDRPLFKAEHFERYAGNKVKIKLKWPVEGRRRFSGDLRGLSDDKVVLKQDEAVHYLPRDAIDWARLVPQF